MCDPGRGSWFGRARVTTKKQCGWNKQASAASRQTTRLLPLHLLLILLWYLWTRPTFWDTSKAHNELILRIIDTSHTSSNQPRSMDLLPLHLQIVSSYWVHETIGIWSKEAETWPQVNHIHLFWRYWPIQMLQSCPGSYFPGYCQSRQSICGGHRGHLHRWPSDIDPQKIFSENSIGFNLLQTA